MGGGTYSQSNRSIRTAQFSNMQREEIFSKKLHPEMSPAGVKLREARDSENHPCSIPIIIALDVTGSMGYIPEQLIKIGLPHLISGLMEAGIKDPQIMFLAIGDHITDRAPLQISQFESGDAEMDMWLQRTWIEAKGGGNRGESYPLAWFFAANCVQTDHWDKRGQKGFIFTIGDERFHENYSGHTLTSIMNSSEPSGSATALELLAIAQEKWEVFHILPDMITDDSDVQWKQALGERVANIPVSEIPNYATKMIVSLVKTEGSKSTPIVEKKDGLDVDKKFL